MAVRLEDQLLVAVGKGDISRVNDLLSKKPNVNYKNESGLFPLLVASQKGRKDLVERLIDEGADVNLCGIDGMTSLSLASEYGHHDIVKVLVEKGAKIDHRLEDGRTPLMIACRHGHVKTVEVLVWKNASIDLFHGYSRHTPITIACQFGHADVVKILLPRYKIPVDNIKNANGATLLAIASANGHVKVADFLLEKGAEIDLRCSNGFNALHLASLYGHKKVVELLLQRGASTDLQTGDGYSALILATERSHAEVVKVLLHYNAEVDLILHQVKLDSARLKTALMIACENKNLEIVKLLLNDKENSEQNESTVDQKREPLKSSAQSETSKDNVVEDIVRPKRSRSAKVNILNKQGKSALNFACVSGDVEIVRILIKHGANVNPESSESDTNTKTCGSPLLLATQNRHASVVKVLLESGANPNLSGSRYNLPPLIVATANEYVEIVDLLLKHKEIDVDVAYGYQQPVTPLMLAIFSGHLQIVTLLVDSKANVHYQTKSKRVSVRITCLQLANALGNDKIINVLMTSVTQDDDSQVSNLQGYGSLEMKDKVVQYVSQEYSQITCYNDDNRTLDQQDQYILPRNDGNLSDILPKEVDVPIDSQASAHASHVGEEPSINNTFRLLLSVAAEWENIGILLNINGGDLSSINADHKQVRNCLREMLKLWLKRVNPLPTWEELAEAVESLGEAKLAAEIKEKYITV